MSNMTYSYPDEVARLWKKERDQFESQIASLEVKATRSYRAGRMAYNKEMRDLLERCREFIENYDRKAFTQASSMILCKDIDDTLKKVKL